MKKIKNFKHMNAKKVKKRLNSLWTGVLLVGVLLLNSCQTEEVAVENHTPTAVTSQTVDLAAVANNTTLLQDLQKAIALNENQAGKKSISLDQLDNYIVPNHIVFMQKEGKHSYTFQLKNDNLYQLQNVVLDYQNNHYKAYLVEYKLTTADIQQMAKGGGLLNKKPFRVEEVGTLPAKKGKGNTSRDGTVFDCIQTETYTVSLCRDIKGNVIHSKGQLNDGCVGMPWKETRMMVTILASCLENNTGSGGTGTGTNPVDLPGGGGTLPGGSNTTGETGTGIDYGSGIGTGTGTANGDATDNIYTTPVADPTYSAHVTLLSSLSINQYGWFNNADLETKEAIIKYIVESKFSDESEKNIRELIDLALTEVNQQDANKLIAISLIVKTGNYTTNSIDSNFFTQIDPFVDLDLTNQEIHDPLLLHLTIKYQALKAVNPTWSELKLIWETTKDVIHTSLDVLGLFPVYGEIADLVNGVIYSLEGDNLNATLSYASTIPVAGWVTAGTKFALKVTGTTQTAYAIATKAKLVWKVNSNFITFGSQSQLRSVLGMGKLAVDPRHAHHLIPWSIGGHDVIQRAARSGSAFHMNEALNGIPVAAWRNQPNHNAYNKLIKDKLDYFINIQKPNATPKECYDFVKDLIGDIRTWVINHPNSHLNDLVL